MLIIFFSKKVAPQNLCKEIPCFFFIPNIDHTLSQWRFTFLVDLLLTPNCLSNGSVTLHSVTFFNKLFDPKFFMKYFYQLTETYNIFLYI